VSAVTGDALIFERDTLARATGGRWEGLFNRIVVTISALVLGVIVICAIFAPWLAPHNPNTIHLLDPYANPSHRYLFGQDSAGRDILSRLIYGSRLSLLGPLIVVAIAFVAGVPLGFLAAYRGGFVDGLISRTFDVIFAFPALLLAIVIVATFGASFQTAVFAVAVTYVPLMGRVVRSAALVERSKPYVEECRLQGYGAFRILFSPPTASSFRPSPSWRSSCHSTSLPIGRSTTEFERRTARDRRAGGLSSDGGANRSHADAR